MFQIYVLLGINLKAFFLFCRSFLLKPKDTKTQKNMGPSVIIYVEYVNNSLLEELLFSITKHVRTNRAGNVLEFMVDNCLYNLTIEDADTDVVKEDLGEDNLMSDGPFYSLTLVSTVNEEANHKQIEQLLDLIGNVMPVCGVVK
ncbi:MAG: hypothetical protein ACI976_001713 [Aureispira sp.]|jgi:hypothetical protein